jgi:hypothetical protein
MNFSRVKSQRDEIFIEKEYPNRKAPVDRKNIAPLELFV